MNTSTEPVAVAVALCPCGCGEDAGKSASGYRSGHAPMSAEARAKLSAANYKGPERAIESEGLLDFPSAAPTKGELAEIIDTLKAQRRRAQYGLPTQRESISFDALADKFLDQYQHTPRSKRSLTERLTYSRKAFGSVAV